MKSGRQNRPMGLLQTLTGRRPRAQCSGRIRHRGRKPILSVSWVQPVDEFYGDRVFMFLDADRFEWKISQTITRVSQDDVAAIIASS